MTGKFKTPIKGIVTLTNVVPDYNVRKVGDGRLRTIGRPPSSAGPIRRVTAFVHDNKKGVRYNTGPIPNGYTIVCRSGDKVKAGAVIARPGPVAESIAKMRKDMQKAQPLRRIDGETRLVIDTFDRELQRRIQNGEIAVNARAVHGAVYRPSWPQCRTPDSQVLNSNTLIGFHVFSNADHTAHKITTRTWNRFVPCPEVAEWHPPIYLVKLPKPLDPKRPWMVHVAGNRMKLQFKSDRKAWIAALTSIAKMKGIPIAEPGQI